MRSVRRWLILICIALTISACAGPRAIRHVRSLDPDPLIRTLKSRRPLADGLASTVHMDFKGSDRHFKGKGYLLVSRPGRFRLEIPGWLGSTVLLMVSDGRTIWAYYPEEGKAYRTAVDGLSLSPYLPFSFPIETTALPHLLAGSLPESDNNSVSAYETESGGAVLYVVSGTASMTFRFERDRKNDGVLYLAEVSTESRDGRYLTSYSEQEPHLSRRLTFSSGAATLEVKLESTKFVKDLADDRFRSPIPSGIAVYDLESGR